MPLQGGGHGLQEVWLVMENYTRQGLRLVSALLQAGKVQGKKERSLG
jgi:hypothetical protein